MAGQSGWRTRIRQRSRVWLAVSALSVLVLLAESVPLAVRGPDQIARAEVLAADAADYVPTAASLPGFREEGAEAEGGDIAPTVTLRRSFISLDGSQRVIVAVSVGSSIANAQNMLSERINQMIRYQGWTVGRTEAISDNGYVGYGPGPDGASAAMMAFRIYAVMSEVTVTNAVGDPDIPLLDNVSRLVARRIRGEPDAMVPSAGFPRPPASLPGIEPGDINPSTGVVTGAPGAEVTGSSGGSSVQGDTIVVVNMSGVDRPWAYAGLAPRPPQGMEYITVDPTITVIGPTQVIVAQTDFWISTFDGRSWTPVTGRSPALQPGTVPNGSPVHGWLTFMIPTDQPALQLTWRLRTDQSLSAQGDTDQTLVIPLTVGATAQASVGKTAPPADAPVVPPSSAPSGPTGPAGPSGPSAPTPTPGGSKNDGGSGSGSGGSSSGGRTPRGGGRLQ